MARESHVSFYIEFYDPKPPRQAYTNGRLESKWKAGIREYKIIVWGHHDTGRPDKVPNVQAHIEGQQEANAYERSSFGRLLMGSPLVYDIETETKIWC